MLCELDDTWITIMVTLSVGMSLVCQRIGFEWIWIKENGATPTVMRPESGSMPQYNVPFSVGECHSASCAHFYRLSLWIYEYVSNFTSGQSWRRLGVSWKDRWLIRNLYIKREAVVRLGELYLQVMVPERVAHLSPLLFNIYWWGWPWRTVKIVSQLDERHYRPCVLHMIRSCLLTQK